MDDKIFGKDATPPRAEHMEGQDVIHDEDHGATYGTYVLVWLALIGLTAITVTAAGINLGSMALIAALIIATVKTTLVMNYFMHVKFDSLIFKIFIAVCVVIFLTMIILTFFDLIYRDPLL